MTPAPMTPDEARQALEDHFGSREAMLGFTLSMLSSTGQPCDVTFYNRPPILDVTVDAKIGAALNYGAGAAKLAELLSAIRFSNGTVASMNEIWTVHPMPKDGIPQADLDNADMSLGDEVSGPNGETVREMVSKTYHCKTPEEADRFLRRFIAS